MVKKTVPEKRRSEIGLRPRLGVFLARGFQEYSVPSRD